MIRAIHILSIDDHNERERLAQGVFDGDGFRKSTGGRIQDRAMVEAANKGHGWTLSVYNFGNAFIHLSDFHDLDVQDPLTRIPAEEREALLKHLRSYHEGPGPNPTFEDIVPLLPCVFKKIKDNLLCYVRDLESSASTEIDQAPITEPFSEPSS